MWNNRCRKVGFETLWGRRVNCDIDAEEPLETRRESRHTLFFRELIEYFRAIDGRQLCNFGVGRRVIVIEDKMVDFTRELLRGSRRTSRESELK